MVGGALSIVGVSRSLKDDVLFPERDRTIIRQVSLGNRTDVKNCAPPRPPPSTPNYRGTVPVLRSLQAASSLSRLLLIVLVVVGSSRKV